MNKTLWFCGAILGAAGLALAEEDAFLEKPLKLEQEPLIQAPGLANPLNAAAPVFRGQGPQIVANPFRLDPVIPAAPKNPLFLRRVGRLAQVQINGQVFDQNVVVLGDMVEEGSDEENGAPAKKMEPDPAGPHLLEFADGNRLHGTLEALDTARQAVVWRRADASAPFTFPMAQIGQMSFGASAKQEIKVHATVKLTGGDWLVADVLGMQAGKLQLKLGDGTPLTVDRAQVEWIYFAKGAAPECYDGPTSFSGWSSGGGWTYRDGALRASAPSIVGRNFESLPDQVEYLFEVDQGGDFTSFTVTLHNSNAVNRGLSAGVIQLLFRGTTLQLWAQIGGNHKAEQVDLNKALRAPGELGGTFKANRKGPTQYRVLEDHPGGRLAVFVDGRKAADWAIGKGKAGENRGGFSFQPMTLNEESEQALSKIRITPWDGRVPEVGQAVGGTLKTDRVALLGGEIKDGKIESLTADKVRIGSSGGSVEVPREKVSLLRFGRPENPPDEEAPVAHVRLAQRGEFDVTSLGVRGGKFTVRTSFGGELTLSPAAVREVQFLQAPWTNSKPSDLLIFKNGDQLRGVLQSAADGQKLSWRLAKADAPFAVETAGVAGVRFAPREKPLAPKTGMLARFRNGDSLTGDFVTLDRENVVLETTPAGQLAIPRKRVQTLYFANDGVLPVTDAATDPESWQTGLDFTRPASTARKKRPGEASKSKPPGPWIYFDGAFKLARPEANRNAGEAGANLNLGRVFEGMPQRVEISFDVSAPGPGIFFSAQLFTEPENPGYMLQVHSQGMYLYDMSPQQRGRGMVPQQQIQFGEKVKPNARQRRFRLLADRPSGRLTLVMDDVVLGQFGQKAVDGGRNLGTGLIITPQQNVGCTFSNLWIGPWNGQVPGKGPALKDAAADTVLLANGDEAQGAIEIATPEIVKLESDAGAIDLPVRRLTMIDFGGAPTERRAGARIRFAGQGVLTLKSYRVEGDTLICESDIAGELKLPLAVVQEMVFAAPVGVKSPAKAAPKWEP